MSISNNINANSNLKWYGWILIVLFVAYLPIASFQLAIKNDFFQAYFPVKYFLSNSIQAGEWPIWNPFLNYGFPIYGDMSLSYWNPLTWIFAVIGYNAYVFTIEHMLYMLLAGVGMFKLMGQWTQNNYVKLLAAISYLCSGFATSHQQHFNWITAVGLLPYCVHYFLYSIKDFNIPGVIKWVLSLTLYITSAHPGMTIGLLLFFICILFSVEIKISKIINNPWLIFILLMVFFMLTGGMIFSYSDVIGFTNRAQPVVSQTGIAGSTHISNWISFLLPLTINDKTGIFTNELTLRNCYIGLLFFAIMIHSLFSKSQKRVVFVLYATGLLFLLLSSNIIHLIYSKIPIINFVRLNAEFRLFALLSMIMAGAIQLDKIFENADRNFLRILKVLLWITGIVTIFSIFFVFTSTTNPYNYHSYFLSSSNIKKLLAQFNWKQAILFQAPIQFILLFALRSTYKRNRHSIFTILVILDLVINTFLQLPFTSVGKNSLKDIHQLIEKSPKGPQSPSLESEVGITKNYPATEKLIGGWGYYSKQVSLSENLYYPLMLTSNLNYFINGTQLKLTSKPFLFSTHNSIKYNFTKYGYSYWQMHTSNTYKDTLIIKQNFYKGWQAFVDGKEVQIFPKETSLIGISLQSGEHDVKIQYKRDPIKYMLILQWLVILILSIYLIRHYRIRYILP